LSATILRVMAWLMTSPSDALGHGYLSFNPKSDLAARLDEGKRFRLYARKINKLAGMVNIDADNVSLDIKVDHDARRHFTDLGPDLLGKVNIERVCVRVVMKLHSVTPGNSGQKTRCVQ